MPSFLCSFWTLFGFFVHFFLIFVFIHRFWPLALAELQFVIRDS